MNDLASGTSSSSSKLIHGGLRYLEQLEFSLVFEAVSERRILMDIAPHMVNPLGFLFPVYKGSRRGMTAINAGMWLYEGLSLFRSPQRHTKLKRDDVAEQEPVLTTANLKGASLYYDCATDDARLTLETALDAVQHGAIIAPHARINSFVKDENGRVVGAVAEDRFTGELKEIRAHAVVNATGPWTDRTIAMSQPRSGDGLLRPTKGVHIVVTREKLPVENAVVCFHPEDGRVLFAIPWGERTYLGTTDTDYSGDPAEVTATRDDVDYLIEAANLYFPEHQLSSADVISTWSGLRPLIGEQTEKDDEDVAASSVSREHQIIIGQDGLITIAGGKLTTYRRMSAEVVDTAVKLLRLSDQLPDRMLEANTDHAPLPGAVGWPSDDDHDHVFEQVADVGNSLSEETSRLLADTYGMRGLDIARMVREEPDLGEPLVEGRPEILAQVDWAVREELTATVTDFLVRRTQLFYRDFDQALGCHERVADRMAELLDWDDATRRAMVEEYEEVVARSRQWSHETTRPESLEPDVATPAEVPDPAEAVGLPEPSENTPQTASAAAGDEDG
jgi:glycerol-3-phosphate dehydrogenase